MSIDNVFVRKRGRKKEREGGRDKEGGIDKLCSDVYYHLNHAFFIGSKATNPTPPTLCLVYLLIPKLINFWPQHCSN